MEWNWFPTLRQPDKTHQDVRKMLNRGIGPQKLGSHHELFETCTKEFLLNLNTIQGDPVPSVTEYVYTLLVLVSSLLTIYTLFHLQSRPFYLSGLATC
jgi:hypothetical protein